MSLNRLNGGIATPGGAVNVRDCRALASTVGRLFVLPAGMRDISSLGVEDEEMNKQELAHIARLMHDLQEYCKDIYQSSWLIDDNHRCYSCFANNNGGCKLFIKRYGMPFKWDITKADIERLERESNERL